MSQRVGDILKRRALTSFVGRSDEKATLQEALAENGPIVFFVHGIAGVGKSSLLEVFSEEARAQGTAVVKLDCRSTEPTERGFLQELGAATGIEADTANKAAQRLGRLGHKVVLALDTYELFRVMDTWLRQVFIPALPDNVRVILCGREAPVSAWLTSPEWEGLFRNIVVGPLRDEDAVKLLSYAGVKGEAARRMNRVAHGHPLALRLAASALTGRLNADLEQAAIQRVIEELTRLYLSDVPDPMTRNALEAASVVRCATQSLLKAMLPDMAPLDALERLRALPFVTSGRDGLVVHDAVREVIAASLKASDPNTYRDYRRAAWRQLRTEVRSAGAAEMWRYTADMLYILENPVIREAFFPSGGHQFAVEPSRPEDNGTIQTIIEQEGPEAAGLLKNWWHLAPETFYTARDRDGKAAGFISIFDPATVNPALLRDDPILRAFRDHLQHDPVPKNQQVLFGRRWLSLGHTEMVSPATAACFLDTKRMYMTLRPNLRRVYATICDLPTLGPLFSKLGFRFLEKSKVKLDGVAYNIIMLDMGPASVDGWLAALVAAELGVEEGGLLDIDARELVIDGQRITLTPLEFGVIQYLYHREGKTVSRVSLVDNVWGYNYDGGSNVVDRVVLSLRKKLGESSSVLETVRGVGYRFRGV